MELEELKNSWVALDNRLKKNEALTEIIIIKMTQNKAKRSISKLLLWEVNNAVMCCLGFFICAYSYCKVLEQFIFLDMLLISSMFLSFIMFFWQIYKVCRLLKMDFIKDISSNICNINRYNILIKREKNVSIVLTSIQVLLVILTYAEMKVEMYTWVFLCCFISLLLFLAYWTYKKIYKKNINSILESLNEIKEIEEKD